MFMKEQSHPPQKFRAAELEKKEERGPREEEDRNKRKCSLVGGGSNHVGHLGRKGDEGETSLPFLP